MWADGGEAGADGGEAGTDGQLSFEASIENGDIIQLKNGATVFRLFDPTLEVPFTIDLSAVTQIGHVIVDHGPPQVGLRGAQIGTRGGGCTIGTEKGGKNGPFGTCASRHAKYGDVTEVQTSALPMTERPSDEEVNGANATLKITADSIHSRVQTQGLEPGNLYTLWWEIGRASCRERV